MAVAANDQWSGLRGGGRGAADAADGLEQQRRSPSEGVHEDRRNRQRHGDHRPHRLDKPRGRERNADAVEHERETKVVTGPSVAGPADIPGSQHGAEVVEQDDYVRRIDGDVGPTDHSDAEVGLHETGSVVDAVALRSEEYTLELK